MMDKKNFCPKLYPVGREIEKTWFVRYYDQAGRIQKVYSYLNKLPTVELREAEAARIIADLISNPPGANKRLSKDLVKQLTDLLEERRPSLSPRSYQTYYSMLTMFCSWYRINPDKTLTSFLYKCMDDLKHPNYVKKLHVFLKMMFVILVKRGQYPANPFDDIKVRGVKKKSLLPFHTSQVNELKAKIELADPNLWFACELMYYCYFRPSELRALQVKHIVFHTMCFDVDRELTKDNDNYQKAIPVQLQQKILSLKALPVNWYLFGKKHTAGPKKAGKSDLWARHREYLKDLGYNNRYGLYSWVHTGIKAAVMAGIPHKQLQLQKGHSDLRIFDEYLKHVGVAECAQLINGFPGI